MLDYVPHRPDFKRKDVALKALPAGFFVCMRSLPCQSLRTTGASTFQELPFTPCLNPEGSAWFQLQVMISSSLHPHSGSGHLTGGTVWMMTIFFHLLLLVSTVLVCSFDMPVPLSCPTCVSSAPTCPALWSSSSLSPHLQCKGILLTAGLLCVVIITSINKFYVQLIQ